MLTPIVSFLPYLDNDTKDHSHYYPPVISHYRGTKVKVRSLFDPTFCSSWSWTLEIEKKYEEIIQAKFGKVVGRTPVPLESTEEFLRFKESELGNFIADIMQTKLNADIGLIQGFNISGKTVLDPGEITLADIYQWFPKGDMVMSVKLTGAQIKQLLEVGARSLPGECGGFVHVSKYLRYVLC